MAVKPRRERKAQSVESLPQFTPRAEKGEIHFVTDLGTGLRRPLWVTADSLLFGELTEEQGRMEGLLFLD